MLPTARLRKTRRNPPRTAAPSRPPRRLPSLPRRRKGAAPPARQSRRGGSTSWLTKALLVVLFVALMRMNLGGIVAEIQYGLVRGRQRAESEEARVQLTRLEDTSAAFRLVAQSVGPSVVHIDIRTQSPVDVELDAQHPWFPDGMQTTGQGSGVIFDTEGYILTNYHVIRNASRIDVRLSDGRSVYDADVVGVDPKTDLALLKIEADGLVVAPWGDSHALRVGDWALAVGNPFGLDRSVTAGIVSAKGRRNVVKNSSLVYQNFLQTDAAINPGNSGGPLINLQGEVIGITTAIVGKAYQGVSFAIPSDIAHDVYGRLKSAGKVTRGWLGVALDEITPELAEQLKAPREGVLVGDVLSGPAEQAGIKKGDIIIRFNGEPVNDVMELSLRVSRTAVDSEARVLLRRDGQEINLVVKIGQRGL